MWVTLFESPDDDEYDGVMGCNDYEDPRVLLTFTVEQQVPSKSPSTASTHRRTKTADNTLL